MESLKASRPESKQSDFQACKREVVESSSTAGQSSN